MTMVNYWDGTSGKLVFASVPNVKLDAPNSSVQCLRIHLNARESSQLMTGQVSVMGRIDPIFGEWTCHVVLVESLSIWVEDIIPVTQL